MMLLLVAVSLLFAHTHGRRTNCSEPEPQVSGGLEATPGQFPYIVSLYNSSGEHTCTGSIITSRWILTAADCGSDLTEVVAGTIYRSGKGGERYKVVTRLQHREFGGMADYDNGDLALLKVDRDINFTELVQPIEPVIAGFAEGDVTTAGWSHGGGDILKYLPTKTTPNCTRNSCDEVDMMRELCIENQYGSMGKGGPLIDERKQLIGVNIVVQYRTSDNVCIVLSNAAVRLSYLDYGMWIVKETGIYS